MTTQTDAIIQACMVQAESCQYTAAGFYAWLNDAKWINRFWNAIPIILGATASFSFLQAEYPQVVAFLAFAAGLMPAVYEKLELKAHTEEILSQAGQYKNLENRFRHAASITALSGDTEALKVEFDALMRQMEDLRARPLVMPEKYFLIARDKIKAGHFKTDVKGGEKR